MSPGSESRVQSTAAPRGGCLDHLVDSGGYFQFSDDMYRQRVHQHKKRKLDDPVNTSHTHKLLANLLLNHIAFLSFRRTQSS